MANVLTILKIIPSDPKLDREAFVNDVLKNDLCKKCQIEVLKFDEEPIAYGIVAILAYLKNEDSEEGAENLNTLQELLEEVEVVSNIEVQDQRLMDY